MTVAATYTVEADWGRDGTFGHAQSDITAYVSQFAIQTGFARAYEDVAPPARITLILDNSAGVFSPENAGSALYGLIRPRVLIRVTADYGLDSGVLFLGGLSELQVAPGALGERTAMLIAEDPMLQLLDAEYNPPFTENVRIDEALTALFEEPTVIYPYAHNYWILDYSALEDFALYENTITAFEAANTTLAFVGDNAERGGVGLSAQGYVRDLVAAEAGGKFYWDVTQGAFVFWNRQHFINSYSTPITFTPAEITYGRYLYAEDVANKYTVYFEPRAIGAAGTVLWEQGGAASIPAGETREYNARYRDATVPNASVGAKDCILPVANTDYTANSADDGSGDDKTAQIVVWAEYGATAARIVVQNPTNERVYLTSLQVRGTPITTYQREFVTAILPASIAENGLIERTVDVPALDDRDFAQTYADALSNRFGNRAGRFEEVTFMANDSAAKMSDAITEGIGATISLADTHLSNDETEYVVIGTRHEVRADSTQHTVTWVLEPLQRARYWVLEDADLGVLGDVRLFF